MATRVTLHDASLHGVDETSTVDVSDDGNMGCCICFRLINEGEPYAVQANWLGGAWHVDCIERGRRALECIRYVGLDARYARKPVGG